MIIQKNSKKNVKMTDKNLEKISDYVEINDKIIFQWVKTNNLRDIDLELPKNQIITITGVSGSGKSSLAFDTIYKEWQFRYIESLSAYLRQFFNLWERPDIEYCSGLSPAIAIEQNKKGWNSRSTVWTLTELDDYIRLLFAKTWDCYCYNCWNPIKPQTIEQIMYTLSQQYLNKKIYLLKEISSINTTDDLAKFAKQNRVKVEKGGGFTRYLLLPSGGEDSQTNIEPIEYFYLEEPSVPNGYFPIQVFWIYDRITLEEQKMPRLKEDIIKILSESKKFGVWVEDGFFVKYVDESATWWASSELLWTSNIEISNSKKSKKIIAKKDKIEKNAIWDAEKKLLTSIQRFTDKMFCPNCNITYPEFTTQHFSPNRQEWACPHCHGMWEVLKVDFDKIIDTNSPLESAILPWRDSNYGQAILRKLAEKYSMSITKPRKDQPEWFLHIVVYGDNELIRIPSEWKQLNIKYQWMEEIIKEQYAKWVLTVDFQAMLEMRACEGCYGSRLKKESLHVFLTFPEKIAKEIRKLSCFDSFFTQLTDLPFARPFDDWTIKINIRDLQKIQFSQLLQIITLFSENTDHSKLLVWRITKPLLDRISTIDELGLSYLMTIRQIDTLSWWEIQRLRLAKQLGNKLTGIVYVLDEPTIGLDVAEIDKAIKAIKKLKTMWNTIIVVEHNEEFIQASDRVVEIWPWAGDFGGELVFSGTYSDFLSSDALTAQYLRWEKEIKVPFNHKPSNKKVSIHQASKYNLNNVDFTFNLGAFTIITGWSWAGKTTLMYTTLFRFLNDKQKFVQSYIRLQMLKKWLSREEILAAPVMRADEYRHLENLALQEFYKDLAVEKISWYEEIHNTIYVDQTSIGKTPRSCPATFINVFDKIRKLYAGTSEAKYYGFSDSYFSFNSDKWACPACDGYGYKKIELQFLPDTYVPCELCHGKRYRPEILTIKWRGKTISEVLEMYVSDALEHFHELDHITEELQLTCDIWLGYLKMGQSAHTLSWGESQRLKLVKHLLKDYRGHSVYFLDEPTVGLHMQDIEKLLKVLTVFLERGDTILMIEHDQNILKYADQVFRLEDGEAVKAK